MSDIKFTVTRGILKGETLKVHQMCNDWITATFLDGEHANDGQPISPTITHFEPEEAAKVVQLHDDGKLGQMFKMDYDLEHFKNTGKFRRPKPEKLERIHLTYDEAVAMLPEGDEIHTFISGGMMLIGADWSRESVLELLKTGKPEKSGEMAAGMGHGLVAFRDVRENGDLYDPLFIKTKEEK